MSKMYDDARYGIERILVFPSYTFVDTSAAATHFSIDLEDKITLVEFGCVVTTAISSSGNLPTFQIREGSTVYGTLSIPSASTLGTLTTTRSLTASALVNSTTLVIYVAASGKGAAAPFLRYRARVA